MDESVYHFRTALSGYHKGDVTAYIEKTASEHRSALLEMEKTITQLQKENRSLHGLTRTLLNNMVVGVTKGFEKKLEIVGVGYRVEKQAGKIVLGLGYSHPVIFEEANGVKFECPDSTTILVKGIDKQAVGQIAAVIRSKRPPEPYLGKGIKYTGEKIRRKAGKTGK